MFALAALAFTQLASAEAGAHGPAWLRLEGSTRWRYESLSDQFRAGRPGSDQQLSARTLVTLEADTGPVQLGAELIDSRVYLDDSGSAISTSNVNTIDILQAYARVQLDALAGWPRRADLTLGRMTIDLGSTRFVGRNGFRNTRNAFTGGRLEADLTDTLDFTGFIVSPVERLPDDREAVLDNDHAFDEENFDQTFWALHLSRALSGLGAGGEVYIYGLTESDGAARELYTPGFRLYRAPEAGRWDFEIEHALQFGERRAAASAASTLLDVRAQTHHSHIGYTFEAPWSPRIAVEYEYASGEEAGDDEWSRWDTLYGLRRTDFGQTGIHGPLRRQNVSAPGVRLQVEQGPLDGRVLIKGAFLASGTDAWAGAGVVDPAGSSGTYIGTHISTRWRYWAIRDRLRLETGGAVFVKGEFARNAPNAPETGDTVYGYVMATVSF